MSSTLFFVLFQVAHELLALQLLTVLLEEPTDDSVEIAVNFTKEIGQVRFFLGVFECIVLLATGS